MQQPSGTYYGHSSPIQNPMRKPAAPQKPLFPPRARPHPDANKQLLGTFAQVMGGAARSVLNLTSSGRNVWLGKDLQVQLEHTFNQVPNTRLFHRVGYRDREYNLGLQTSLDKSFIAANIGFLPSLSGGGEDVRMNFDGRFYHQMDPQTDFKAQVKTKLDTSSITKSHKSVLRGCFNYRQTDFSCTAELEKSEKQRFFCTLSFVQALTKMFQCGAQLRFDLPVEHATFAFGLRAAHPNGNLSATIDNMGFLKAYCHRRVSHYTTPYLANVQLAAGLDIDTKSENGPETKASLGWQFNFRGTGVQVQGSINNWMQAKLILEEPIGVGAVSLHAGVSHWSEKQAKGLGPRYEFGILFRYGEDAYREPGSNQFEVLNSWANL